MIPKIIHYCWFGQGEMPQLVLDCIASWHKYMPDWEYKLWNEDVFDICSNDYTREAYDAKKYAFVSDYVRLIALNRYGGLYLDVDFKVYKPFDELLQFDAFAGFEGSKTNPLMMGVIASKPNGQWVREQLNHYVGRSFILADGTFDLTTNVRFITDRMLANGFINNGLEQDYLDLHVFPVDYFCPKQTTGEYIVTENTFCEHMGLESWSKKSLKREFLKLMAPSLRTRIIKIKRMLIG